MKMLKFKTLATALVALFVLSIILVGCGNEDTIDSSSNSGSSGEGESSNSDSNGEGKSSGSETELDFPKKPVQVIVPFAAGGGATITARTIVKHSEELLGSSLVVENREGGGGSIGQQLVADAEPDGYTLLLMTGSTVTNPIFNETNFTYEDFTPIIQLVGDVSYLYVNTDAPYDDIDSFIEYGKAHPGEITLSSSSPQASDHYVAQDFLKSTGIDGKVIPYDGETPAITSVAGGHDTAVAASFASAEGQVEAGKLKPILVLNDEKSEKYPDLPTSIGEGIEATDVSWRGLAAPKGTDPEIIQYLHDVFKKGYDSEEYQEQMEKLGLATMYKGPEDFQERIVQYYEKMSQATK